MTRTITSTSNPRIIDARKLSQRKHRTRQGRFAAEGLQVLGMAVEAMASTEGAAHIRPDVVFDCETLFTTDTAPRIRSALEKAGAEVIHVSQRVLESLSDRSHSQGLVATFSIEALLQSLDPLLLGASEDPSLLLVLDRPQYPGNIGTLIRTADAVGAIAVVVIEPAGDPFDPKCIRATMGSVFAVPLVRMHDAEQLATWSHAGIRWVAADLASGESVWEGKPLRGSIGLILGNEGEGVQDALRSLSPRSVLLPQRGHAESLNVSVAGGVLMYEWMRVNQLASSADGFPSTRDE